MGHTACTEPQCLYSRAIPLLPLWAVRPVQTLSACTVELYLYSPYGPYGLYRASVPVQGCTLHFIIILQHTTFGLTFAHQQGAQNCWKHLLNFFLRVAELRKKTEYLIFI
jgi:hypothetical protein